MTAMKEAMRTTCNTGFVLNSVMTEVLGSIAALTKT
jgi:hypothetical protein